MPEPCRQEKTIESIHSTLERLETSHERMMDILERIAEQGAYIKSLQEGSARSEKSLENLFKRVGKLEIDTAGEKVRVGFIIGGASTVTALLTTILVKHLP